MRCPHCGKLESKVLESREVDDGLAIRRRRECENCNHRFTTYERIELTQLMVIKKSGIRETYQREKLAGGIYRALEKRPFKVEDIELIVSRIEQAINGLDSREVSSVQIGEMVMNELLTTDDVAYVRFASVYRSFTDVSEFAKELKELNKEKSK